MSQVTQQSIGFDLDMTLIDSSPRIIYSTRRAFEHLGLTVSDDDIVPLLGRPLEDFSHAFLPNQDPTPFVQTYRDIYQSDDAPAIRALPGAQDALKATLQNHRVLVISAKLERLVVQALEQTGLREYVSECIGDHFGYQKSKALLTHNGVAYVGDHTGDIDAAHGAGCTSIGVATGIFTQEQLARYGAEYTMANLKECAELLPKLT